MSEPEVVRVLGRPLRCQHCEGERFYQTSTHIDVPLPALADFFFGRGFREAVLLACAQCGLCQFYFPGLAKNEPTPEETAVDDEPVQCLACGQQIPQGSNACPACNWTWSS